VTLKQLSSVLHLTRANVKKSSSIHFAHTPARVKNQCNGRGSEVEIRRARQDRCRELQKVAEGERHLE
jgi:hypothetical protein